jgi:hypothetical protein
MKLKTQYKIKVTSLADGKSEVKIVPKSELKSLGIKNEMQLVATLTNIYSPNFTWEFVSLTHLIKVRNEGHKSQYFTLRIMREGQEAEVHTSKDRGYLLQFIPAGSVETK